MTSYRVQPGYPQVTPTMPSWAGRMLSANTSESIATTAAAFGQAAPQRDGVDSPAGGSG